MTLKTIAFGNLKRRKAKAAFVLLGLLIGTTAVVAFVTLVGALTFDINHKLETYGANILVLPKTETLSLTYGGLSLGGVSFDMQELRQDALLRHGREPEGHARSEGCGPDDRLPEQQHRQEADARQQEVGRRHVEHPDGGADAGDQEHPKE